MSQCKTCGVNKEATLESIKRIQAENAALKEQVAQLEFRNERLVADYAELQGLNENHAFNAKYFKAENEALKQQVEQGKRDAVPEGWKLLKDSTQEERSWPEDFVYENGNYFNTCCRCDRTFMGHKRRPTCKVCFAAAPKQEDAEDHLHQGFYQSNIKQEK